MKIKSVTEEGSDILSCMSLPSIKFNDVSLVVKKTKQLGGRFKRRQPDYKYTVRFRHTKEEIAKFNVDVEGLRCVLILNYS